MPEHDDPMAQAVATLQARLAGARTPYELLAATPANAHIRFVGPFRGVPVVWNARVHCVAPGARRYIEVGARGTADIALAVGLDVSAIDEPTLRKTVTMVRQWKGLQAGRHEFG
jgi:hypothetical protein